MNDGPNKPGADGWSTVNEYAWLTSEGYQYDPDLVVLAYFVGNDPGENADRVANIGPGGRVIPRATGQGPWQTARSGLSDRFILWNLLESGAFAKMPQQSAEQKGRTAASAVRDPSEERKSRGWRLSEDLLRLLRDYCAAREIPLMIVGIPMAAQLDSNESALTGLVDLGSRLDVPTVDLLPQFKRASLEAVDSLYYPKDQHWTAKGHDLAARAVAAELRLRNLVPGRSQP